MSSTTSDHHKFITDHLLMTHQLEVMPTFAVTGASGFIASHIVRICLERGYAVRACVRDPSDPAKTAHLSALAGAEGLLSIHSGSLLDQGSYDEAIQGCEGVFHVASPLPVGKGVDDPETTVLRPAVEGTINVLEACQKAGSVQSIVLTSSMSAMAPVPEPSVKSEEHWSDPDGQKARKSFYGASKTLAEMAAYKFVEENMPGTRLVIGQMLQPSPNMTMLALSNWLKNGKGGVLPNDSMSFVDVRDCAAQHVAAMENEAIKGRFMSLDRSLHWNDLEMVLREIHPDMPHSERCEAEPIRPTQFDKTRQESLGVSVRPLEQALADAAEELRSKNLL